MITDIKEFGANLGNREYWDSCGAEWNHTTIEQKIFKLAEFVQAGGDLYPVIYKYAKGREYTYRRAINWCILDYLNTLMVEGYYINFMLLDNKEAVKLLTELLKVGARCCVSIRRQRMILRRRPNQMLPHSRLDCQQLYCSRHHRRCLRDFLAVWWLVGLAIPC